MLLQWGITDEMHVNLSNCYGDHIMCGGKEAQEALDLLLLLFQNKLSVIYSLCLTVSGFSLE